MKGRIWLCLAGLILARLLPAQSEASEHPSPNLYQFGKVGLDAVIQHTFTFSNTGATAIEIRHVQLTPRLVVTKMTSRIEPGAEGKVTVEIQKPLKQMEFDGVVVVHFKNDLRKPETFYVQGEIVPPVEFIPHKVIFLSTQRGEPKSAVVEIVNHEADPMEILSAQCDQARFTCQIAALEPGRRYRLTLTLKGEGPGAQQTDTIVLPTSSRQRPFLEIKAFSKIRDRVYAFPDSLDFETIDVNYLKAHSGMVGFQTQSLTVFRAGSAGFQISVETDVPFLRVSTHQSPQFKDRFDITASIDPTKLKSGPVKGAIVVLTNDPEFPKLTIPVSGTVEGNW
jgi:uncharacterized protein DUF1573